ncbi:glycosyltransferase family 9 protein [Candidatus Poribacteria bacterium]|nr:glycosyltransferase family 9 protein [Candidatus Poribacteria bacterium]
MHPNILQKILDRYIGSVLCFLLGGFQSRAVVQHGCAPQRILLIQLSAIGDTILTIPTIRSIRNRFPNAHLAMVASSINLQYLEGCPYIDQYIPCRLEELMKSPRKLIGFIVALRRQKFDCVVDFEHWARFSALIAYGSGASRKIGFRSAGQHRHYLFTDVVEHVPGQHEVVNFLKIARLLGCPIHETDLEVWLKKEDEDWAGGFFDEMGIDRSRPVIAIHPEAGRRGEPRRRFPQDRFVSVIDTLVERYNAQIILTGAPSELEVSQQITAQTRAPCVVAAGKTEINQLAALFANADFLICGNCGPMHLAAAAGTPVVALHGPTNPSQWAPWGSGHTILHVDVPCSPCLNLGFEYGCSALSDGTSPCMHTIQVEEVLKACERYLINERGGGRLDEGEVFKTERVKCRQTALPVLR